MAVAIAVIAGISAGIYLGLAARGQAWPVYVLAVASAPLALLAVVQAIGAVANFARKRGDGD